MWVGNRCFPPKDVSLALESLFGQPVGHIKVIQYSIYVRFHWRAIAPTRPGRIYLRGSGLPATGDEQQVGLALAALALGLGLVSRRGGRRRRR